MPESNPIVLITGANRGIGFELARTLARDHSFHVLLGARNTGSGSEAARQLQSEGLSVEILTIDLTNDASIAAAAEVVKNKFGRIDVLVNNAGANFQYKVHENEDNVREIFEETFQTNVFGTSLVTRAFIPLLEASRHGPPRILFLTSRLGSIADRIGSNGIYSTVDCGIYRASKAAVNMLCAEYARKYSEKGWKVNAVCPGFVKTALNQGMGNMTTVEAMPNLVRLCIAKEDGETGTFIDPEGAVGW